MQTRAKQKPNTSGSSLNLESILGDWVMQGCELPVHGDIKAASSEDQFIIPQARQRDSKAEWQLTTPASGGDEETINSSCQNTHV